MTRAELTEARRIRREAALAAREQMTPPGRAEPGHLRIGTWNVNSLKARAVALKRFLDHTLPDVLLLQETKSGDVAPAAHAVFSDLGYQVVHAGQGQYNGVAIASLHPLGDALTWSEFDEEHLAREPRLISVVVDLDPPLRVASVYVPHGREVGHWHYEYKLGFLAGLRTQVERWLHEGSLLLGGDFNVAPTDSDIFHPDAFVGNTHVTAAERGALSAVLEAGLIDLDARRWGPRERRFTWWKPGFGYSRNLGMRIDLLAADRVLADRLETTWIDHVGRGGDRPSDHAALLADFRPLR